MGSLRGSQNRVDAAGKIWVVKIGRASGFGYQSPCFARNHAARG